MTQKSIFDRAFGCFLGQAIGDALGTRYEFKPASMTQSMMAKDLGSSSLLPILGGGPFTMEAGQVTDDTEMAMALARSIQRRKAFDVADVAKSYARWFCSEPPDIGTTTCHAFDLLPGIEWKRVEPLSKEEIHRSMVESSSAKNKESLSNGFLMRISPLAIAGSSWPLDQLIKAAVEDCLLTHPNPVAHDAVSTYVTALWYLINTGDRQKAYDEALARVRTPLVRRILEPSDSWAVPVANSGGGETAVAGDGPSMGYFGIALKWAFHSLRTVDDFADALCNVIKRGGDTDTNGCIAGALLGAYVGASKVPTDWTTTVLTSNPRRLLIYDWVNLADGEEVVRDLLSSSPPAL